MLFFFLWNLCHLTIQFYLFSFFDLTIQFYPSKFFSFLLYSSNLPSFLPSFTLPTTTSMADTTEFTDWEVLQSTAPDPSPFKSDYFSLPPNNPPPSSSEEDEATDEEGGIDSDNPSSHGEIGSDPILDMGFQGIGCADSNSNSGEGEGEIEREGGSEEGLEGSEVKNGELGKKKGGVWEIVKYCLSKVKPAWYVSLAGAILGLVWIGRRMHRIKEQKKRSASVQASMDGKRVTKYAVRAVHVNEALKHVPILRPSPLAGSTIPISLLALR